MRLKIYWQYYKATALLSIQTALENRTAAIFFTTGKFLRFLLFLGFIFLLGGQTQTVTGYSVDQLVIFFLVFNLFDLIGQIFFRGIYWFRDQIVSGEFDFRLVKPLNPLFQALTRQTDILDVPLLVITLVILVRLLPPVTLPTLGLFGLFTLSACLILTAIHIFVASLGVLTTSVDHTIMIFRDISAMARFPLNVYGTNIRSLLTFVIPIALVFTYPAEALLGSLTLRTAVFVLLFALLIFALSYRLWLYSLRHYSSASS